MKVKITEWNKEQRIIDYDDEKSINEIVKNNINSYIEIEYIDADIYQKHLRDRPLINHTDYFAKRTYFVNYATNNTPNGKICDTDKTIIERTKDLMKEFEKINKIIKNEND